MRIQQFRTGGDRNYGYLAGGDSTPEAVIVDPSFSPGAIVDYAREMNLTIRYILCTHDHHDHTNGNAEIERLTGRAALLYGDTDPESDTRLADETRLPLGDLTITILHTPGHTPDSMCIAVGDAVFTGDTLFVGKVGGTDLHSGAVAEYEALHRKLLSLPDETRVFPGHDYGIAPQSTIGTERRTNPFLLRPDLASFVDLKRNWAAYKKEHGIA